MLSRIKKLQKDLGEVKLESILITHPINRRYITGFTGSHGLTLITPTEAILITDFRYVTQVRDELPHMTLVEHQGNPFGSLENELKRRKINCVGFEQDHVTYSSFIELEKALDGITLTPVQKMVESLRIMKDEDEVSLIRKAAEISDYAFSEIIKVIRPGMKEIEVALKLEFLMREQGASSSSFDMIVASGVRSALPHGTASDKRLEKGDLVTLDFGAFYKGYASDMTRTIMLGAPNKKQREIYETVLIAQTNTIRNIKPGMTGMEADHIARKYISEKGYGDFFGHGTGHGLGMEVHEDPRLSKMGKTALKQGMVVTVEPGIYLSDFGGVRIEDDILITKSGCDIITKSNKELIILD